MIKDYYVILGVSRSADLGQIKRAYRDIAKQCHPDARPSGDPERFREVQEAYETLSDQDRRQRYDRTRTPAAAVLRTGVRPEPLRWTQPARTPVRPLAVAVDEIFRGPFSDLLFRERLTPLAEDRHFEVTLSPGEAHRGCRVPIRYAVLDPCPGCAAGILAGRPHCPVCGGQGRVRAERRFWLQIPPGTAHGQRVFFRLSAVGLPGARMHVTFRIDPDR